MKKLLISMLAALMMTSGLSLVANCSSGSCKTGCGTACRTSCKTGTCGKSSCSTCEVAEPTCGEAGCPVVGGVTEGVSEQVEVSSYGKSEEFQVSEAAAMDESTEMEEEEIEA